MAKPDDAPSGADVFMSADELRDYADKIEMARASRASDLMGNAQNARKELLERLSKPVQVTEQMRANVLHRLKSAATQGLTELKVLQFPVELCTDNGRAINNSEPDWPETLTGVPRQVFEVWRDRFQPAGYRLSAMIVEWPQGMPGDVGFFLAWDEKRTH